VVGQGDALGKQRCDANHAFGELVSEVTLDHNGQENLDPLVGEIPERGSAVSLLTLFRRISDA